MELIDGEASFVADTPVIEICQGVGRENMGHIGKETLGLCFDQGASQPSASGKGCEFLKQNEYLAIHTTSALAV